MRLEKINTFDTYRFYKNLRRKINFEDKTKESDSLKRDFNYATFYHLIYKIQDLITVIDENAVIAYESPSQQRILGYQPNDLVGRKVFQLVHPEDYERVKLFFQNLLDLEGHVPQIELRYLHNQGHWINLEIKGSNQLKNPDVKGIILTARDVTLEREAASIIKNSDELHRMVVELSNDVIIDLNLITDEIQLSPRWREILGYPEKELEGNRDVFKKIIYPDDFIIAENAFANCIKNDSQMNEILRFIHHDGSIHWMNCKCRVIKDEQKIPVRMVGSFTDITEKVLAETEMQQALQQEQKLNEMKSQFCNMVAHEFRTPLSTILTSAELMEMKAQKNGELKQSKSFQRISTEVERLASMLENALNAGNIESGKVKFNPTNNDIKDFIENLIKKDFSPWMDGRKIELKIKGKSQIAYIDILLFQKVCLNLFVNAFKYSKNKRPPILTLVFKPKEFCLEIKDFGIGIPANEHANLFQSFFRASNTNSIKGTGLGLYIVKQILEMHQGNIKLKSIINKETTFTISIPYNKFSLR